MANVLLIMTLYMSLNRIHIKIMADGFPDLSYLNSDHMIILM